MVMQVRQSSSQFNKEALDQLSLEESYIGRNGWALDESERQGVEVRNKTLFEEPAV